MTQESTHWSAVGITKTLRGKDTTIEKICKTANDLLDGVFESQLYLPDKEKFVLQLVIDRLSQQKSKGFKVDFHVWQLFCKCWNAFTYSEELITTRNKLSSRVRFNEIIVQTLTEICNSDSLHNNIELIQSFNDSVSLILKESKLSASDDQSLTIISKLLQLVRLNENNCPKALKNEILSTCYQIYRLSNTTVTRYGPKNVQAFCSSSLPTIIYFENIIENEDLDKSLKSITSEILFRKENLPNLHKNIQSYISASLDQNIESKSVVYCFQLLITKVEISELEVMFTTFTNSYPDIKGNLLEKVVSMNRTLSVDFLSNLVEEELNSQGSINYSIINKSLERNSAVGIKFANKIMTMASQRTTWNQQDLQVVELLMNCYTRSRELPEFVEIYKSYMLNLKGENILFVSDSFINALSEKLITLSNLQLQRLTETLIDEFPDNSRGCAYVLISIATGLLKGVSGSMNNSITKGLTAVTETLKPLFAKLLSLKSKNTDYLSYWSLIYLIMCLYDLEDFDEVELSAFFSNASEKDYGFPSFHFCAFRVLEQKYEAFHDIFKNDLFEKFLGLFKQFSAKSLLISRWFVLLEYALGDFMPQFVDALFDSDDTDYLSDFLSNDILHEQSKLMGCIIGCLISKVEKVDNIEKFIGLLNLLPVYCYSRSQRENLLNAYTKKITDGHCKKYSTIIVAAVSRIMEQPTFKSKLETDLVTIYNFLDSTAENELSASSFGIVTLVLSSHLKQGSDKVSSEILSNITLGVKKDLEGLLNANSKSKLSLAPIKVTMCLFQAERDLLKGTYLFSDLYQVFFKVSLKMLSGKTLMTPSDVCVVVDAASAMNLYLQFPEAELKKIIPRVGFQFHDHSSVSSSLFALISSMKSTDCIFLMSLFTVLYSKCDQKQMLQHFKEYLDNVDQVTYFDSWRFLITSFKKDVNSLASVYCDLLAVYLSTVERTADNLTEIHKLVTESVSAAMSIEDASLFENMDSVLRFTTAIQKLLTNKSSVLTQYTVELIVAYSAKITYGLLGCGHCTSAIHDLYSELSKILTNTLMVHRFRFSNRQHLLVSSVIPMMELMFQRNTNGSNLSIIPFEKLMSTLCEPSSKANLSVGSGKSENNAAALTTTLSIVKAQLRKSLPNLLLNYIHFYLKYTVSTKVRDEFNRCIFLIFDVLTTNELNLVNHSIDSQGRVIFRNIYDDYKKFGKWKED